MIRPSLAGKNDSRESRRRTRSKHTCWWCISQSCNGTNELPILFIISQEREKATQRGFSELCVKSVIVPIWSFSRSHRNKPDGRLNAKLGQEYLPNIPESPAREKATQRGLNESCVINTVVHDWLFSKKPGDRSASPPGSSLIWGPSGHSEWI